MNTKSVALRCLFAPCLGLLYACSGGDINFDVSGPGIPANLPRWSEEAITAYGVYSGYGTIIVNDVGYGYSHTIVTVNGRAAAVSDLRRGQVITVRGRVFSDNLSGTADRVDYDARVIGPVESVDAPGKRIRVMGQTVVTGPDTVFAAGIDPANFAGLAAGSNAEVSGFVRADGAILATWIDSAAGDTDLQVIGEVAGVDLANLRFKVSGLTVDYSGAVIVDLPGGAPSSGMTIKIVGNNVGGHFVAEQLIDVPALAAKSGRRVQTEGLITRLVSAREFYVNDDAVVTNSGTAYHNGDRGDLALNTQLVVDGRAAPGGRITANRVSFD